jgi:hypothetical protein
MVDQGLTIRFLLLLGSTILFSYGGNEKMESERISDEYLDPMNFNPESLIGIPHIYDVFRKGNVTHS